MRILALAMQVPDSRAAIRVKPDGSGIDHQNLKFVCNPFDEFAVEQALRLKEQRTDVEEVVALAVGAPEATDSLRTALAMGADRGIQVKDERFPAHDEIFVAKVAAAAIQREPQGFDLILCGKQTIDNDAGELGPALAEFLGWPHVGAATRLELAADGLRLRAARRIEGAEEVLETALPVLVTCEKGLVEPRYPPLPSLIKARKKPLEQVTAADLPELRDGALATRLLRLSPPAARPACTMLEGEPEAMARELVRLLREEAKVI